MDVLVAVAVVAILTHIPYVGTYFRLFYTAIHESVHAIFAKLFRGRVDRVKLFSNTEGVAEISRIGWFGIVVTIFAGYPVTSFISLLMMWGYVEGYGETIASLFVILLLVNLVLWIRNWIGAAWVIFSILIISSSIHFDIGIASELIVYTIVVIVWSQALLASIDIMVLSFRDPRSAGDAAVMRQYTKIPSQIWGVIFFLFGLAFFIGGMLILFGTPLSEVFSIYSTVLSI